MGGGASASAPGRTTLGDNDGDSGVSHDSLESILEVGREARFHHDLAPEPRRFAHWWATQGAEDFVQAQSLEVRSSARRLLMERYTAERARVRVELARMCTSSMQRRQGAREETIGLYFLCRCGLSAEQRIYLPYAAANALLDFLGSEYPAMRGTRPNRPSRAYAVSDFRALHPVLQLRMGLWHMDFWHSESDEFEGSDTTFNTINTSSTIITAMSTGSLSLAFDSVRRYVRSLVGASTAPTRGPEV